MVHDIGQVRGATASGVREPRREADDEQRCVCPSARGTELEIFALLLRQPEADRQRSPSDARGGGGRAALGAKFRARPTEALGANPTSEPRDIEAGEVSLVMGERED